MNCSVDLPATDDGIAVVVVTHESGSTIDQCLSRLRNAHGVSEIRVVDNQSTDDTLDVVQQHALDDARVRFIANPDNPGFAVGCNQGAADSHAPWLAFVNPDLLVEPDTLQRLRDLARQQPLALLGVEQVDEEGQADPAVRRRDPDFAAMLRHPASASRLSIPRDLAREPQPVEAISGALMLLPRSLHARLGGLDEGYRLHAEDLDFCRRAREAGALVAVANGLQVLHVRGVSSRSRPLFVEWHKHRGLWRYFRKFESARRSWWVRTGVFGLIWARFPLVALRAWWR